MFCVLKYKRGLLNYILLDLCRFLQCSGELGGRESLVPLDDDMLEV